MEKKFKPFDKVIVRDHEEIWQPDLYGFWDKCRDRHQTMMNNSIADEDILPYEGNEELVGTTDEPDEEVRLEKGDWIFVASEVYNWAQKWSLIELDRIEHEQFCTGLVGWCYAVKFSDFVPDDMEETKKHILCVKNGKIVKYKD